MRVHPLDISAILTLIVGVGALAADSAFQGQVKILFPSHAPQIVAGIGFAGIVASLVLRTIGSPSGQAAAATTTTIVYPPAPPGVSPKN